MFCQARFFVFALLIFSLFSTAMLARGPQTPVRQEAGHRRPYKPRRGRDFSLAARERAKKEPARLSPPAHAEAPLSLAAQSVDPSRDQDLPRLLPGIEREGERFDKPAEAAEFFWKKRVPVGETDLPVERYFVAREMIRRMPRYSTAAERPSRPGAKRKMSGAERELPVAEREMKDAITDLAAWTPLGPGNIGGRTRAILIDPNAPQVIYAAGVAGGVWKTTNGGESWVPITDLIANIAVNSLAMDPKNSKVIYAGTGEGYFAIDNVRGAGIFKTEDAGATWKRLDSTANNANFHYVNDLVISSSDSRRIYAATRTGVWQTLDGGESWARVLNPRASFGSGTVTGGCLDLAIRTDLPADYVFASCGTFEQSTVYLNKDAAGAASTWTSVLTETGMGRTSLAIAPSDQKVIYAVASAYQDSDYPDALYAVFRSTSGGDSGSWTAQVRNSDANKLNTSILSSPRFALATSCGIDLSDDYFGQGWYDNVVAVDPLDANRVWVGGIDLFRSDDGGVNWGIASNAYIEQNFLVHPDHHAIVFHPKYDGAGNQIMYVGNDGGVYRTDNARGSVATGAKAACSNEVIGVNWVSLNNDYGVTQFYHGLPYPDGRSYFGGTQDNGTLRGTDEEGSNSWRLINGGDGGFVAVDQQRPNVLYAEFTGITIRKSTDAGKSFSSSVFGIADGGSFINPYVMDPSESQRLYTGGDYLWRTSNGASNWSRASALTAGVGKVTAIAVSPTDSNYALAGMSDGYLLRTNIALISGPQTVWNESRPRGGNVSSVAFDPTNREIVYATYSTFGGAHVWRSIDGGANWSALDGSGEGALPDLPVHSIVVDPGNTSRLYIGTDLGVFVSNNGGASWAVENTGFANVVTEALAVNINDGVTRLFAFTHGRGAWRVTLNNTGCNFSVSPATLRAPAGESTGAIEVSAQPAGCEWQASSNADWISVEGGGSGHGRLNYRVSANHSLAARAGTVTVAGRSLAVIQEGQVDATGPVIEITEKQVANGLLRLAGTARDEGTIVQVSWTNDRGQSGIASGTERWTITDLPLAGGINQITINARDESGNIGRTMITLSARVSSYLATFAGTGRYGYSGENGPAVAADLTRPIRLAVDRTGNVYFTDSDNYRIRKVDLSGRITTVAGTGTRGFSGDQGPALEARLDFPIGVALDSQDNLYILDSGNRRVRKVSAATGVITTVAGNGSTGSAGDNGPAISAQLNNPQNVAVDASGNLFISDFGNQRIRKVTASTGIITTVAGNGTRGFGGDGGPAVNAMLSDPNNVSVDAAGNLYLTDAGNSRIRRVASDSGIITTIVGNGEAGFSGDGGPALAARLLSPVGAIVDGAGNLYFSDRGNHRVRKVDVNGVISTIAGNGRAGFNGDGLSAVGSQLSAPTGLGFDLNGALLIGDRDNYRIRRLVSGSVGDVTAPVVDITAPTTEPQFDTAQPTLELKGTANDASELIEVRWANDRGGSGPAIGRAEWTVSGIPLLIGANRITISALDAAGNVGFKSLIANYNPSQIILTAVGKGTAGGTGDGRSSAASELWLPGDVAIDRQGNLYIADTGNHRIRKVTREGAVEAFAGSGELGSSGDGGPAREAAMNMPCAVTVDAAGNVYIADTLNHRVRKVTVDGRIVTVAGTGVDYYSGDGGPAVAAELNNPIGLALDRAGNLFIADANNNRVRRVDARSGIITTVAGNGTVGDAGDGGPATSAQLYFPTGVALDDQNNLFISDLGNQRVRRVINGVIANFAGTGERGFDGDDGPAELAKLRDPYLLRFDGAGDLYIADSGNHRVRRVKLSNLNPDNSAEVGTITTVAGNGTRGAGGDGGDPLTAQLNFPSGMAVDGSGALYIADYGNHRIRKVTLASTAARATIASAASFINGVIAPESIAIATGQGLSSATVTADLLPPPTDLGGTTVTVRDSTGVSRLARLLYVSPDQINFEVPAGTSAGTATFIISSGYGRVSVGTAEIAHIAPGIYFVNSGGVGLASATILRLMADGGVRYEPVVAFDATQNGYALVPIDLSAPNEKVVLVLFATGLRFRSASAEVGVTIAGRAQQVLYASLQGYYQGLDQVNVLLDPNLAGSGEVEVVLTVEGKVANVVKIRLK